MDKYLVQDKVPVRKVLKAFGKEVVCPVHRLRDCVWTEGSIGSPRGDRGVHGSETAECYASGVSGLEPCSVLVSDFFPRLRNRTRLENYNTPRDAANLIWRAKKIVVLTGAGISKFPSRLSLRCPKFH